MKFKKQNVLLAWSRPVTGHVVSDVLGLERLEGKLHVLRGVVGRRAGGEREGEDHAGLLHDGGVWWD